MRTETSGIRVDDVAAWRPRADARRRVRVAMRMNHARIARAFGRARRRAVRDHDDETRLVHHTRRASISAHGEHFDLEQQRAVRRNPHAGNPPAPYPSCAGMFN